MSGHSKWATIKRVKAVNDAKRGAVFTKFANIISVAAKEKGSDIDTNFSLRMAVEKAKAVNMPKDSIEKAIKRGTGELAGGQIEELYYEGIGPANSQFIIKSLTDNKNRSAASIRHALAKHGGSLGSVMWNFEKRGVIRISENAKKILDLELELIDAGADDIQKEEEGMTILTQVEDLQKLKSFLEDKNVQTDSAEIEFVPKDQIQAEENDKEKIEKFIEALEENEDVSDYYTNVII